METGVFKPPNKPGTANPRNRSRHRVGNTISRGLSTEPQVKTALKDRIAEFLERELNGARSDSDRVFSYEQAFDMLTAEFQQCRPLLELIKQKYDAAAHAYITRARSFRTDSMPFAQNDDSVGEIVNRMRRARRLEFQQTRADNETLLEEMTKLRVTRSGLQHDLDALESRRDELFSVESEYSERMTKESNVLHELIDEIKQLETDDGVLRREIEQLDEKIEKTIASRRELEENEEQVSKELEQRQLDEMEIRKELRVVEMAADEANARIQELYKERVVRTTELGDVRERQRGLRERHDRNEARVKEALEKSMGPLTVPVHTVIEQFLAKNRR